MDVLGRKVRYIKKPEFLEALTHDDGERLKNESSTSDIQKLFVRYIDHAISELLYLFSDNEFFKGKIIENRSFNSESIDNIFEENRNFEFTHKLHNNTWISGKWSVTSDGIGLKTNEKQEVQLKYKNKKTLETGNTFEREEYHKIIAKGEIEEMIMFFSQINNRIKMKRNKEGQLLAPNKSSFGETTFVETICN